MAVPKVRSAAFKIHFVLFFALLVGVNCQGDQGMRCLDEDGRFVYWFVNYKLPKLDEDYPGTLLAEGKAYAHITSRSEGRGWNMSRHAVTSEDSMMAKTLQTLYDNKQNTTYLLYNDEAPTGYIGSTNGHLKGVVAFNGITGFWLVHSIPKAFGIDGYEYPSTALMYGQSVLCVTFTINRLDEICNQLLYTYPNIYESHLTRQVAFYLNDKAKSIFSDQPAYNRQPPFNRSALLLSEQGEIFMSVTKNGRYDDDIYSALLAPVLETPLSTETWRRGSGTYLPPSCDGPYDVTDIASIRMDLKNGTVVKFKSTDDHSKWAVTSPGETPLGMSWFCSGDMNRMESQEKRGGGALCFENSKVITAFQSLICDSDSCPPANH